MSRILLLLEHKENQRLLSTWLATHYEVVLPQLDKEKLPLQQDFDLCILDGVSLERLSDWVQERREVEHPVFLPFLLVTSRSDVGMITRHLWRNVDELIISPIEKLELQARVEILGRSRIFSQQLYQANQQLQNEMIERQKVEVALAESEAKFRSLVQNSSDVIMVVNEDGFFSYVSPSSQAVLGFSPEELKDKNFFDFIHPEDFDNALAPLRACSIQPDFTQLSEYRFRHQDGSWHYLESKSNFSTRDDSLVGIIVNSRDITKRKQAELEIYESFKKERELNELKSRFVSMVSHEIRNPLNSILAATQILERYGDKWEQEKKKDFFSRIVNAVRRMTELLDDVLILGKAETRRLDIKAEPIDLDKFSFDLVEELRLSNEPQRIIYTREITELNKCISVCLDQKLLRHILINLLSNATKYSLPNQNVYFKLSCNQTEVIFKIQDEGIGIPVDDIPRLFEAFHRATNTKNIPGTGLGLAIVKRCVEIQGGAIAVESQVGIGTTFTVTLPLQGSERNS